MEIILIICLTLSIALNLYYFKTTTTKREVTYDARELLSDLTRGPAIVKIVPISADDIFLRSPRD